jgi:quinol-cytochrome oxidoreductase complex cytochrome b subunit
MRRYMPSVKYKAMQKIILGLLVVGVLVAAFLITRPLIQIVEENLSTAEQ